MMNLNKEISKAFSRHAHEYLSMAKVQQSIGENLFDRLELLTMQPEFVLDLGCGPGAFSKRLKQRYRHANVVGIDYSYSMLKVAQRQARWSTKPAWVNADMMQLPFQNGQFDLIFSNQVIHWAPSLSILFREINRILRPGGCVFFSTLGPDTFTEIRQSFQHIDTRAHVNDFCDMHDIGDELMQALFVDPVVDMEHLTAMYSSVASLIKTIKAQGVRNIHANRNPGLTGKKAWSSFEAAMMAYATPENKIPLTYEVIYGHAWKGMQHHTGQGVEVYFPIERLKKK